MITSQTLIIGASSGIAQALSKQILQDETQQLILISRDQKALQQYKNTKAKTIAIKNYSQAKIENTIKTLATDSSKPITRVFICLGLLHSPTIKPEKRLEDIEPQAFSQVITANALTPIIWLKYLTPILTGKYHCRIVVFSARIGSISDNGLGGWYSYRASKAALNMLLKSAAIELGRRAKNIKLIAFHPGTTDTKLSQPFQHNVAADKLFTPEFVASQLLSIMSNVTINGEIDFIDWQGKSINW